MRLALDAEVRLRAVVLQLGPDEELMGASAVVDVETSAGTHQHTVLVKVKGPTTKSVLDQVRRQLPEVLQPPAPAGPEA